MKKTMLKTLTAAALGLALGVSAVSASAADISTRLIRFGYGLNQDSKQGRAADYFVQRMNELSGGKFKVKAFGGAALGSDIQMQNALIGGAQEMMVGSTSTLVGIDKRMGVWDLPFLFDSAEQADKVLDGPYGQKLLDNLQDQGLVGLVYWENGFRNMTNSKRPIEKMSDMDGVNGTAISGKLSAPLTRFCATSWASKKSRCHISTTPVMIRAKAMGIPRAMKPSRATRNRPRVINASPRQHGRGGFHREYRPCCCRSGRAPDWRRYTAPCPALRPALHRPSVPADTSSRWR